MNNDYMVEELTNVWKNYMPKQLAKIFKEYAISKGLKQYRQNLKDYSNTYLAYSSCGGSNWNRVNCYYHGDNAKFGHENLVITLRKKAGDYLIVEREGKRAFEVDYHGIRHYDKKLLAEIISEHEDLFKALLAVRRGGVI